MLGRIFARGVAVGALLALACCAALMPVVLGARGANAAPSAPASLIGNYRIADSGIIIAIADCGAGQLCGRVAARGQLPEFIPCRPCQATSAVEPLCGAELLTRLHPTRTGWQGEFFDPRAGVDYNLDLRWSNEGTLLTQRYNAPPFLTRSMPKVEAWTRVAAPDAACGAATPTS